VQHLKKVLDYFSDHGQIALPAIEKTHLNEKESVEELAAVMLPLAENHLGEDWVKILVDGYIYMLMDINRSQVDYERRGKYLNKSYDDVFKSVYNDPKIMDLYHWGAFVCAFAWEHHVRIYNFYRDIFLPYLNLKEGRLLDLGCGSGIWSFLATHFLPQWTSQGIDISKKSVSLSTTMAKSSGLENKIKFSAFDALSFKGTKKYNAAVSCFLMEHLEEPQLLLQNMATNLEPRGYAFIAAALTAAEVDHIYEFRRESEVVLMAEEAGFRVVSMYSSAPLLHPVSQKFLPRGLALVLQKRKNDIW
jgi:2-polyprenyl-3-methyl-5-hydroxy-6-metoxy-1,4-benzoquinol methylase